jgi:glyoxylase-like metal-dependent hydrolase (beta-lactamase superfamily II)
MGVPVYASEGDGQFICDGAIVSSMAPRELEAIPCKVDFFLHHGDFLNFCGVTWKILLIRGHSPAGITYYVESMDWAFTGDSVFRETIGRSDLPGGDEAQLIHDIGKHLLKLPQKTQVFPGHGPSSTIGHELRANPYFLKFSL